MSRFDDLRLDNSLSIKGIWALEANLLFDENGKISDKSIPGNLDLDRGKIYLDLNGRLSRSSSDVLKIYGYLDSGLFVILEGCFVVKWKSAFPGYVVEKYFANKAYILDGNPYDVGLDKDSKVLATRVNFSLDYLEDWYNVNLPKYTFDKDTNIFSINYNNKYFDENSFEILDGDYNISFKRNLQAYQNIDKGAYVISDSFISISTKNYRRESVEKFIDISNWVKSLNDYLTQLSGRILYFEFYLEDATNRYWNEELENGNSFVHSPYYKGRLIFSQIDRGKTDLKINSLKLDFIKDYYNNIVINWFKNKVKLEYIIDLNYQNSIIGLDISTILTNKIKMMETYYDNYIKIDKSKIDEDIKKEITNKLSGKPIDKIYLKQKLMELLENIPYKLKEFFSLLNPNWEEDDEFEAYFANRLKDTRHYYTHGSRDSKKKERLKTGKEFINANIILDVVIYYYILRTMEVEAEEILNFPFIKNEINMLNYDRVHIIV